MPDGSRPLLESNGSQTRFDMSKKMEGQKRKKVLVVGAGAAGIDFLHHATRSLEDLNVEIKCFDKNPDVGGTWYENRYPGCACDGPSPSYQFAWRPNPDWSHYYCGAPEIWQYMKEAYDENDFVAGIRQASERMHLFAMPYHVAVDDNSHNPSPWIKM